MVSKAGHKSLLQNEQSSQSDTGLSATGVDVE